MKKVFRKIIITFLLAMMAVIVLLPMVITISNSLMDEAEITHNYQMVAARISINQSVQFAKTYANLKLIPDRVSIRQYYAVLIKRFQYLLMFWNSLLIVVPIIAGQIVIALMAAYAFAKLNFPLKKPLFFIYITMMLMPFQVTLVPNYLVADKLGLINSYWAIIFPGIFNTFGVFLLKQYLNYIPDAFLEAARMDGASHLKITWQIILPMSKPGIAVLGLLSFIDNWNMVEQPLIFIQDTWRHPLSLYLAQINAGERGIAFAAATIYMLPVLLIFLYGENYLIEGIQLSGIKS